MKSSEILIIDDDINDIDLTLRALEGLFDRKELIVANDGAEALDILLRRGVYAEKKPVTPSLILVDRKMPRMDGIEFLQKVRKIENLKFIPVVLFTSSNYEKDIQDSYSYGANGYVVKPINTDDYFKTVKLIALYWTTANESVSFKIDTIL